MSMTVAIATVVSILAIAALAWAVKWMLRVSVCPICLGVGGTWLTMVVARYFGVAFDTSMLPVLLGGSAVGVAYQLEKHLPEGRSALLWKTLFIPLSLAAGYGIALPDWTVLAAAAVAVLILSAFFFISPRSEASDGATVEKLQEQMKKCC
jgi:hypothetical protein